MFYCLKWIHPNSAEIPFWNAEAEKLLVSLQNYVPAKFEPNAVKSAELSKTIKGIPSQVEKYIANLFEQRQKPTKFSGGLTSWSTKFLNDRDVVLPEG